MDHPNPIRQGDQYACARCGKAWDVDDQDPPPCLTKQEARAKHIQEIRERLNANRDK